MVQILPILVSSDLDKVCDTAPRDAFFSVIVRFLTPVLVETYAPLLPAETGDSTVGDALPEDGIWRA